MEPVTEVRLARTRCSHREFTVRSQVDVILVDLFDLCTSKDGRPSLRSRLDLRRKIVQKVT